MKKIIFIIIILLSLSAIAKENTSNYYLYGEFDKKEAEGITRYFNIYDGRGYITDNSGYDSIEPIPDGTYTLKTQFSTLIKFTTKSNNISDLKVLSKNQTLKDQNFTTCQEAVFLFNYLSVKENFKDDKGVYFQKYQLLNYAEIGDYIFILKDDARNRKLGVGSHVSGVPVMIEKTLIFSKDASTGGLSVTKDSHPNKFIEVNNCNVKFYKQ